MMMSSISKILGASTFMLNLVFPWLLVLRRSDIFAPPPCKLRWLKYPVQYRAKSYLLGSNEYSRLKQQLRHGTKTFLKYAIEFKRDLQPSNGCCSSNFFSFLSSACTMTVMFLTLCGYQSLNCAIISCSVCVFELIQTTTVLYRNWYSN